MSDAIPTNDTTTSPPPLRQATISDLSHGLNNHFFTSEALTKAYISRIHEVNPEFHAIIQLNPHATHDAALLDAEYAISGPRSTLHRIPILLKDNIPTLDDTDTTCGSLALVGARPPREADVVTALRKAGAVVLGKANMAEWCGFRSTSGCSGWSARGGQTTGCWFPNMKASGSSSGCAVAVALGLCGGAIGTETCYSVVSPAEKAGIVGFKPTRNLISSDGLIHASKTLDTVGLLTRTVHDARLMLRDLVQHSTHHTSASKLNLLAHLNPHPSPNLQGMRIGIPTTLPLFTTLPPSKHTAFTSALSALKTATATLIPTLAIPGYSTYTSLPTPQKSVILATHMKPALESYFSSLSTNPHNIHTVQDLITFTQTCVAEEFPARNTQVLERAAATSLVDPLYSEMCALDTYLTGEGGIEEALKRHACEVLVIPGLDPVLQMFAAKEGGPVASVPIGMYAAGTEVKVDPGNGMVDVGPGIPFSAYIFGRVDGDGDVLRVAEVLEGLQVREGLVPYLEAQTEIGDV